MSAAASGFDEFLADIQPFFYRRSLTYVDVGAYQGEMLERLIASKLKVREAHLIEPNPASLQAARRRLGPLFKGNSLNFHALALGARAGRVRMAAAKTMTRVLAGDDNDASTEIDTDDNVFDADCSTLDALAHRFTDGRISLLKIDVEGHEDRVLGGAARLLGGQQVDVVYIEAGMNPQGTQQCYYRRVEDLLTAHGYRLFKIYEQQYEWMDDSPLLRRVNMAFMSASFAERNPYRLTLELNRLHDDLAEAQRELDQARQRSQADAQQLASLELQGASTRSRLETRLAESAREIDAAQARLQATLAALAQASAAQAELEAGVQTRLASEREAAQARLDGERQAAQAQLATLQQQTSRQLAAAQARLRDDAKRLAALGHDHAALSAERDSLRSALARANANQAALARRLSRHEQLRQGAEETQREVFGALSELQRRHLGQQTEAAGWWVELERLKRSRKLQLATLVARHARTLRGCLQLPLALWRAFHHLPPPAAVSVDSAPCDAFSLKADKPRLSLALSARAQSVLLPKARQAYEVWLHAFPSDPGQTVLMGWLARPSGSAAFDAIDIAQDNGKACRLDAGVPRSMPLLKGTARCWLRVPAGQPGLRLELRRLRGELAVVKLELKALADVPAPSVAPLTPAEPAAAPVLASAPAADPPFSSEALEMKLWGGYAPYALQALEQRKLDKTVSPIEREHAAWYLIRWYMVEGDAQRALENAEFTRSLVPKPHRRLPLAEAQCLVQLGRPADADACLQRAMVVWPERQREFQLYRSTVIRRLELARGTPLARAEALQLDAINLIFQRAGLSLLQKRDGAAPLELSNIVSQAEPKQVDQGRKVSVVIPLYNAEASIASVIDSLLRQTWRNLEVIVVDDCSSDAGCEVVDRIAAADARVRLVRKPANEGAYATRNAGARLATGHFITVHDSDDWSHPQKIETQIACLDATPTAVAVTSHWVRMGEHLEVVGPWVPKGSLYDVNFSSLLFERRLLETTGLWDPVKISGDAEFVYRLRALYGENAITKVPSSCLLSLSMVREDSLTRAKATHLRSLFYGLRWNYRDAYLAWQREHEPGRDAHPVDARSGQRRFPLPMGMRPGRTARQVFDVVVVADFAEPGEALHSALACLRAAAGAGQRAAAFHWRAYERPARTPLQPAFYAACQDHGIEIASPGDELDATRLLVCEPALLQHRIHPAPAIRAAQVVVIVAALPAPTAAPGRLPFDPRVAREHLAAMFGSEGVWVPQTDLVRQAMRAHGQYPAPAAQHWLPLVGIDADAAVRWRGDQGSKPVIGRHGSPSPAMWPTDAARLRHSHGVSAGWPLRVLGDAGPACALLGERPAHWWLLSALIDTPSFLADLDFYLHYPAEQPPPLVTQGLLEALAAGLPVLLPPSFEPVFGPAAAYAEADQVATLIDALWSSQARYEAQARAGREFARRHGDRAHFAQRLQALAEAPAAASA